MDSIIRPTEGITPAKGGRSRVGIGKVDQMIAVVPDNRCQHCDSDARRLAMRCSLRSCSSARHVPEAARCILPTTASLFLAVAMRRIPAMAESMSSLRDSIKAVLKSAVVPTLRSRGFKGSYPHFRRFVENGIDLLTFQHDKWGGGFVIEIACAPIEGVTTHWGKVIAPHKVTAWDLHPNKRKRIQPFEGEGRIHGSGAHRGQIEACAKQVLEALPRAEAWWSGAHSGTAC